MIFTVTVSDDGVRVLESWLGVGGTQKWLQDAIDNKLRARIDASILEHTEFNPKVLSVEAKLEKLSKITLPTRIERDGQNGQLGATQSA